MQKKTGLGFVAAKAKTSGLGEGLLGFIVCSTASGTIGDQLDLFQSELRKLDPEAFEQLSLIVAEETGQPPGHVGAQICNLGTIAATVGFHMGLRAREKAMSLEKARESAAPAGAARHTESSPTVGSMRDRFMELQASDPLKAGEFWALHREAILSGK